MNKLMVLLTLSLATFLQFPNAFLNIRKTADIPTTRTPHRLTNDECQAASLTRLYFDTRLQQLKNKKNITSAKITYFDLSCIDPDLVHYQLLLDISSWERLKKNNKKVHVCSQALMFGECNVNRVRKTITCTMSHMEIIGVEECPVPEKR